MENGITLLLDRNGMILHIAYTPHEEEPVVFQFYIIIIIIIIIIIVIIIIFRIHLDSLNHVKNPIPNSN